MKLNAINKTKIFHLVLLLTIASAVLRYRYQLLLEYSFLYTDSDQNIMWGGLKDYASGIFKEPRFYGQNYNTFLEALLALPLNKMGFQAYTALPFVSMCLVLFPFFYLGTLCLFKQSVFYGLLIVALPLCLPFEYGIITNMPRGFVTALPFAALACTALFFENRRGLFLLSGFMGLLAISVNSNSLLLVFPCLFYLWLKHFGQKSFYLYIGMGLALAAVVHYCLNNFYERHPFYNIHPIHLTFSFTNLAKGLTHINAFLNFDAPFFWQHGVLVLVLIGLYALFFLQQKRTQAFAAVLAMLVLLLLSFGFNKIHDGTDSLNFHCARMFLSLPLLLVFCFILVKPTYEPMAIYWVLLLPWFYYGQQMANLSSRIEQVIKTKATEVVLLSPVKPILDDCKRLNTIAKKYKVDLFVIANHFYADAYASGCNACEDGFPSTLNTKFERRTWRMLEAEGHVYQQVLIIDMFQKIDTSLAFIKKLPESFDLYLVPNNHFKTMDLLDTLHIPYRQFR